MSVVERNNVRLEGSAERAMILAHGVAATEYAAVGAPARELFTVVVFLPCRRDASPVAELQKPNNLA
jgi:hypothetical protein